MIAQTPGSPPLAVKLYLLTPFSPHVDGTGLPTSNLPSVFDASRTLKTIAPTQTIDTSEFQTLQLNVVLRNSCKLIKIGDTDYHVVKDLVLDTGFARGTIDRYTREKLIQSPVKRQRGRSTISTYTIAEFQKTLNDIKEIGSAQKEASANQNYTNGNVEENG